MITRETKVVHTTDRFMKVIFTVIAPSVDSVCVYL